MTRRITTALLGTISVLAVCAPAWADTGSIETVVVTAEKRSEEAKNVPMSLTVIGEDQLNNLNLRDLQGLVAQTPGLTVSGADPAHPILGLRGIEPGASGSTVSTYLDETPFGSQSGYANANSSAANLDTFDMARIEVLRGPQGTLYGAGAEGGLLKFVTNAPDFGGFDDALEISGTDLNHGGAGYSFRGMVNVALTDDLALRVVGFDSHTPGYIDDPALDRQHVNDSTNFGGRASLLWEPTSKLSIRVNVAQQQLDEDGDSNEDVVVTPDHKIKPKYGDYVQQRSFETPQGVRYYLYNTTINWDLDFATLTSSTSYTDLHQFNNQDGSFYGEGDVLQQIHQGRLLQELRLASDPGRGPLDWMIGYYFANEHDTLHDGILLPGYRGTLVETEDLPSKYIENAVFANGTYHVTSNFELGAGVRYSHNNQSDAVILGVPPDFTPDLLESGTAAHNIVTWSGDARYHLDDNSMLYARVASGWQPGGPNPVPFGVTGSFSKFLPESLINYELGIKSTLPDENLSFDADVYAIEWSHIQLLESSPIGNVVGNGHGANSKGIEANITWLPVDRLTLNLNGAFNDATLSANTPPSVGGLKGDPLPDSPRWSGALNADYTFMPTGGFTPFVGATWHYVGIRGWGFSAGLPEGRLPDYSTLELRLGVDWQKWSLELYGKNLTGSKGIVGFSSFGLSAASGAADTASRVQPRLFGIVLRGKF